MYFPCQILYNKKQMSTFEEEYLRIKPQLDNLINTILVFKKIVIKGEDNFLRTGGNIIIGNHIGSFKDVATMIKIVPRQVFFTANKDIFTREDFSRLVRYHLTLHLKNFGASLDSLLKPLKYLFVEFISSNIEKIGTIPVDLTGKKRMAIKKGQEYVRQGRAIITLQGRGRIRKVDHFPYVSPFRGGPALIAYNLLIEQDLNIPVTPVAMFGTHFPWIMPSRIHIRVGEPLFVKEYVGPDMVDSINRFKDALELRVRRMMLDIIRTK
jgi:1-acyl-sn-glycerol-3-phosphate acyltransferase